MPEPDITWVNARGTDERPAPAHDPETCGICQETQERELRAMHEVSDAIEARIRSFANISAPPVAWVQMPDATDGRIFVYQGQTPAPQPVWNGTFPVADNQPPLANQTSRSTPMTAAAAIAAIPEDTAPTVERPLVTGSLTRDKGSIKLRLDLRGLHAYLDQLGVERDSYYGRYVNCPGGSDMIDTRANVITPRGLCQFKRHTHTGRFEPDHDIIEVDIMGHYSTPPTMAALRALVESIKTSALEVIAHYQPVEITLTVKGVRK